MKRVARLRQVPTGHGRANGAVGLHPSDVDMDPLVDAGHGSSGQIVEDGQPFPS